MSIKPIDMQVLLPKLHKNDLLKPHVVHKVENEQMLMQNVNKQESQEKLNKVNSFEQKESPRVREDGKHGAGREASEQNKDQAGKDIPEDKKSNAKKGSQRNHIDIKV